MLTNDDHKLLEEEQIFNAVLAVCMQVYPGWDNGRDGVALLRPRINEDQVILVISRPDVPQMQEYLEAALPGYEFFAHPAGKNECAFATEAWYWRVNVGLQEAPMRQQSAPVKLSPWRRINSVGQGGQA